MSAFLCCWRRQRPACGQGRTKNIKRSPLEKKLVNEIEVKLENLENPEGSDGPKRMLLNGYVKDPTIHGKRREGIDKDAYDYAEVRMVPKAAYLQKDGKKDDEDCDGYQVYTGPPPAKTAKKTKDIYVNHTVTKKDYTHNKMSQQKLSDHQTTENSPETRVSSGDLTYYENLKSVDNYYENKSNGMKYTDYENVNYKETDIGTMVAVRSNNVKVKTVNQFTAVNTSTINIDHAEYINITTVVQFVNVKAEKSAKESDKNSNTW
ncbi:Hypothetical predicted protein [Mytilus galloprovincialis]|uniref:Uncharacterized protein n=1 Tax=Mytilus galloprovincialis TaxID=29158 RepID=A0A8B6CPU3_MYTGA|nr:Hypothetical predicted protein [Mytilus galloprovincialis]